MAIRKWLEPPKAAQSRLSAIIDQLGPGAKAEGTAQDPGRRHERAGLSRGITTSCTVYKDIMDTHFQ